VSDASAPTEAAVMAVAESRLGQLRVVRRMAKGHGSLAWLLERRAGERLLVKVEIWDDRLDNVRSALDLANQFGVPAPRLLEVVRGAPGLHGRALSVLTWIDGADWADAARHVTAAERERALRELGELLARMHRPRLASFADTVTPDGPTYDSWRDLVVGRLEALEARYERDGAQFASVVARGRELVRRNVEFPGSVGRGFDPARPTGERAGRPGGLRRARSFPAERNSGEEPVVESNGGGEPGARRPDHGGRPGGSRSSPTQLSRHAGQARRSSTVTQLGRSVGAPLRRCSTARTGETESRWSSPLRSTLASPSTIKQ
jgi:hypothetical protein